MSPDKILHVILFAGLVFLALRGFLMQYHNDHYRLIYTSVLLVSVSIGAITEIMQKHIWTGRSGNVYDFGADALGCLTGLVIYNLVRKKIRGEY